MNEALLQEQERRSEIWTQLQQASPKGDGRDLAPSLVNELKAFYGGRGIWRDKDHTQGCSADGHGVTVGVLHTGRHYEDDLDESGGIYHYPSTKNSGVDLGDIEATKNCRRLELPLFVVRKPTPSSGRRHVSLGWVVDWDDGAGWFLIQCGETSPSASSPEEKDFAVKDPHAKKGTKSEVTSRPDQRRFKVAVFKRYGARCSVSGLEVKEMLDAAHIVPKSEKGADDARNGLVLSASLHRAYDRGLWAIHPESLKCVAKPGGPSLEAMGVTNASLLHLEQRPHKDALEWAWKHGTRDWGDLDCD